MNPRPGFLLAHLALGAILSTAIAWSAGLNSGPYAAAAPAIVYNRIEDADSNWGPRRRGMLFDSTACTAIQWHFVADTEPSATAITPPAWCRKVQEGDDNNDWCELAAGWPLRCFWKAQAEFQPLEGAIPLPDPDGHTSIWSGQSMRGLPIHPIWPGLLADSLIWSAICLPITLASLTAMRWQRTRRGRCPQCSYNRLHNYTTPCPECGHSHAPSPQPTEPRP